MDRFDATIFLLLVGCAISVWSVPLDEHVNKLQGVAQDVKVVAKEQETDASKEDSTKAGFQLPAFLLGARPAPITFGNASAQGEVGGLFATNENSLFVVSGPNSNAIANLTSTAAYYAQPINETQSNVDGGDTASQNLAGFTVTAQEDSHAYAEGEYIQYINHGASYATGWGDSTANGSTFNPGSQPSGSGWKRPGSKN